MLAAVGDEYMWPVWQIDLLSVVGQSLVVILHEVGTALLTLVVEATLQGARMLAAVDGLLHRVADRLAGQESCAI